jgi:hypothetical protein
MDTEDTEPTEQMSNGAKSNGVAWLLGIGCCLSAVGRPPCACSYLRISYAIVILHLVHCIGRMGTAFTAACLESRFGL